MADTPLYIQTIYVLSPGTGLLSRWLGVHFLHFINPSARFASYCFANMCRFPHDAFRHRKAVDICQIKFRIINSKKNSGGLNPLSSVWEAVYQTTRLPQLYYNKIHRRAANKCVEIIPAIFTATVLKILNILNFAIHLVILYVYTADVWRAMFEPFVGNFLLKPESLVRNDF